MEQIGGHKLDNCNTIKAILMLLVIVYHSCVFWTGTWWDYPPSLSSKPLALLAEWLNTFHVHAFTLISGYIYVYKINRGEYQNYKLFITKKIKRLIIPYLFVTAIWIVPISASLFHWDTKELIRRYILCEEPSQLWFLWMLFDVFILVWPVRKKINEKPKQAYLYALGCYAIGILARKYIPNYYCIWSAFQFMPYFILGMRIRDNHEQEKNTVVDTIPWYCWMVFDIALFFALISLSEQNILWWHRIFPIVRPLQSLVGSVMAWSCLQMICSKYNLEKNKRIEMLIGYSMPIYMFHQQFIYFSIRFFDGVIAPFFHAFISFGIAFWGSYFICFLMSKSSITRRLVGISDRIS